MNAVLTDGLRELRRPFALRGVTSRRALAGLAIWTALVVASLFLIGLALGHPLRPPFGPNLESPMNFVRGPFRQITARVPEPLLLAAAAATLPLLLALLRRSREAGIARAMALFGAAVMVVSYASIFFVLEERLAFPLTQGLWAVATNGAEDFSQKVGIGIVLSPVFLMTVIADILLILLIGIGALVGAAASTIGAIVVACLPPQTEHVA